MQRIYWGGFLILLLSPSFSPSLLYCTNLPNISYAMSRLLNFKLPLLIISSHRMSVPYAEFIRWSSVPPHSLVELRDPRYASGLTTNSPCLSVCPCHKTVEILKGDLTCANTHTHTLIFRVVNCLCHQLKLAVCDTIGPRRPEMMSQQIEETSYVKQRLKNAIEASFYNTEE